ncbi:MAG TPA: ImmA/IrrE family metallo-endopeptidase [Candidatus Hodarchaeales archaeon]|nr:ImmA/IrrE family metallo-endopeptidase [Candidatus Hodarchaeales archaeon]
MNQAEFRCKWLRVEDIWDCAEDVRNRYWSAEKLPVDVEAIVEFKLKLDIDPENNLMQKTDMEAYLRSDLRGVVVDHDHYMNEKFANRMRFSFAHELGHFFLHKDFYAMIVFESAEEWKEILLSLPDTEYRYFEYQANEFAGRLLVPREDLVHEIENALKLLELNNMLEYLKADPNAVLSRISTQLSRPFGVSTDVIERRVDREKLWPPDV